jgi:metal-responsive CopG/Arc/MetJ family transcriptional regulator
MSRNITLSLDEKLIKKTRVLAAREHKSTSRFIGDTLRSLVEESESYEASKREALKRLEKAPLLGWKKPSARDELHDR